MDWISVKDRLPNSGQSVLVCLESKAVTEALYLGDKFVRPEMFSLRTYKFKTNKVTHWMPLPQPPKED